MVRMVRMVRSLADRTFQPRRRCWTATTSSPSRTRRCGSTRRSSRRRRTCRGTWAPRVSLLVSKISKIDKFCKNLAKFCKFLAGSFSAVSKRNFARKYAFDSIFQALQDLRCILLHRCNLNFFAKNRFEKLRISQNFWKFSQILANSVKFY